MTVSAMSLSKNLIGVSQMEKITVIIPVYNTEQFLEKCIRSVVNQTYQNLEIILVDDGSTDDSYLICQKWAEADDRIKLIHKENGGQSSARNMALDIATGDYIAFVDSDDWIEPDMYEVMLQAILDTGKDAAVCNIGREILDGEAMHLNLIRDYVGSQLWRFLFSANLWNTIRMPLGRYAEDAAVLHEVLYQRDLALVYHGYYHYCSENPDNTSNAQRNKLKNVVDRAIAFMRRYHWMLEHDIDRESCGIMLDKVAYFIIATMGRYLEKRDERFREDVSVMLSFVKEYYLDILKNKYSSVAKKGAISLIHISPKLYYRIRNIKNVR